MADEVDPNEVNAIVRSALDGTGDGRYPCNLGVSCDGDDGDEDCGESIEADFMVHESLTRANRLGYVLDWASEKKGWRVLGRHNPETALTYCPKHAHLARALGA